MNRSRSSKAAAAHHEDRSEAAARRWLNLGVLAHVDAGKTSLTEALLYAGGALDEVGRVDDGTTQTDTLAMERRRGITIRTAVATFQVGDVVVNLIDTPGHPDFIAEVDRSLAVLDGAVLVVSAVEGVQAQTIVLHRALGRLGVPAMVFVNKIDRVGADPDRVLASIRQRLTPALVPLGTAHGQGTAEATFVPASWGDPSVAEVVTAQLAEHDEELLNEWVHQNQPAREDRLWEVLGQLTRRAEVHPVVFGSARTGAGVSELIDALTTLLRTELRDPGAAASGQVFKIERAPDGDRVCSVRMRDGMLAVRDVVELGPERVGTVTALEVHEPGGPVSRRRAVGGEIVRVHGLTAARIGDWFGPSATTPPGLSFPPPALETTIVARDPRRRGDLLRALSDLANIDPLIRLRPAGHHGLRVSVYGEVQQEVIADTLAAEYGVDVDFRAITVLCVERPARRASAAYRRGDPGHLYDYTLGVMVEPAPPGSGVELVVGADRATLPMHVYGNVEGFRSAVLGYLREPLAVGPNGWPVTDVQVTVTESGYQPPAPTPADVRNTTTLVVAEALRRAGTVVCEPVDRFRVETPDDTVSNVLNLLARHRAVPDAPQAAAIGIAMVTGTVPTVEVDAVRAGLATAAHGEAVLESTLHHYRPVGSGSHR